jgi:hypothetical protein
MRKSRLYKIGIPLIAVLSVLLIYRYGFVSIRQKVSFIKEEQSVTLRTLEKYESLIARMPDIKKNLSSLKEQRKNSEPKLFSGNTAALAGAALQETVKGIIASSGGTIRTERINEPSQAGQFTVLNVGIEAEVPNTEALSNVLYGMETRTPYMVIKELDVRVKNIKSPADLSVRLDVLGLTPAK